MKSAPVEGALPQVGWRYRHISAQRDTVTIEATHTADGTPIDEVEMRLTMPIADLMAHFEVVG